MEYNARREPRSTNEVYRCQFCGAESPARQWNRSDECPKCGRKYDAMLAQEEDD